MLRVLKHDVEVLYQYGSLGRSLDLFKGLSNDDRKRLIFVALVEGDDDVKKVVEHLMKKLDPIPENLEELLMQMNSEDRAEAQEILAPPPPSTFHESSTEEIIRIIIELQRVCGKIGSLDVEEAFWIIILRDLTAKSVWIEAISEEEKSRSSLQATGLSGQEKYDLISLMRESLWAIHVHNHPSLPSLPSLCLPSEADLSFAASWKADRPELSDRMKFFVVQGNMAVEYGLWENRIKRWL